MEITEVRVKLIDRPTDRLKAFCTVTFDHCFVVRDLKVIEGPEGLFVAMPSRKLTDHCPRCGAKNHLKAAFCNDCGAKLPPDRGGVDAQGRVKLHADVAHPINAASRQTIQTAVVAAYQRERQAAMQPGYKPRDLDFDDDYEHLIRSLAGGQQPAKTPASPPTPKPGEASEIGGKVA